MGMMIVRHKVKDYGQWRPIFDQHAEMQRGAGLLNPRSIIPPTAISEIVVVFDTEDTKKTKEFAASADLKEAMERLVFWIPRQSISLNRSIDPLTMRSISSSEAPRDAS